MLLTDLLCNISSRVEESVQSKLQAHGNVKVPPYYYQLIAQYFVSPHGTADQVVERQMQYWSALSGHESFPSVFCLLCHLWALDRAHRGDMSDELFNHVSLLIAGANRVFWSDVQSNSLYFKAVYGVMYRAVVHQTYLQGLQQRLRSDLEQVVSRFLLYYKAHTPHFVRDYLVLLTSEGPEETKEQQHLDLVRKTRRFVLNSVKQLRAIRNEQSLITYMRGMEGLRDCPIDAQTANTLQAELYAFVTPGGKFWFLVFLFC